MLFQVKVLRYRLLVLPKVEIKLNRASKKSLRSNDLELALYFRQVELLKPGSNLLDISGTVQIIRVTVARYEHL